MTTSIVWVAMLSSVAMGLAGACVFVVAVKRNYFSNFEDAKYHVFWSDLEPPSDGAARQEHDRGSTR